MKPHGYDLCDKMEQIYISNGDFSCTFDDCPVEYDECCQLAKDKFDREKN